MSNTFYSSVAVLSMAMFAFTAHALVKDIGGAAKVSTSHRLTTPHVLASDSLPTDLPLIATTTTP